MISNMSLRSQKEKLVRSARKLIKSPRRLFGYLFLGVLILGIVGFLSFGILLAWVGRALPDPENLEHRILAQSTKIFDRTGTHLLYEVHGEEKRTIIELDQIPKNAVNATIAIEDKDFFTHRGVAFKSVARAAFFNLFGNTIGRLILRRSAGSGGASTITQQFVKNSILTNQRTLTRKIKEALLAVEMERRFTKEQILKLYFNEIPYGSNAYGIEAAAETFFGKSAKDLDLPEAALVAALPQAPTRRSPYGTHTDELLARERHILDLMAEQGYISAAEASDAKKVDILKRVRPRQEAFIAPHFVLWVRDQVAEEFGDKALETDGLKITTTLDYDKQLTAEKAVADGIAAVEKSGGSNAALVALDPQTGEILAMVGSRDFADDAHDGKVNVVLRPRQPGSSFKPIVYATAFENGFTPDTILYDLVTKFKTDQGDYEPKNYDLGERGPVTVRSALAGSLNIPAVKMIAILGVDKVLDFAERLGYTTLSDRSRFGLSLVLGGGEVTLLEHASAFGTFATEGVRHATVAVLKIEDSRGNLLKEWKPDAGARVFDEKIARAVSDVLSDNGARAYVFGENNYLTLPGRPTAAKTGTTNDFHDAWTVGYAPQLVAGVWTGNNNNKAMKKGADGSKIAAPIWRNFMRDALKGAPVQSFGPYERVITGKPILDGVPYPEEIVEIDRASGKRATAYTPGNWIERRAYRGEIHDTLYWIDQSNPQFERMEAAVRAWAEKSGLNGRVEFPPSDFDDLHVPENQPRVSFVNPTDNGRVGSRSLFVQVSASAPRGVRRIEFALDGQPVGSAGPDSTTTLTIPDTVAPGFHTLTATAFDDIDNSGTTSITLNFAP